jgi:hypothetical protein
MPMSLVPSEPVSLTPAQIEQALKLEQIFFPYARKQREQLYSVKAGTGIETPVEPARFVHYTTAEAALNIIRSRRMWMRNCTCMSDYSEVQHGFQILQRFFSVESNLRKFTAAIDRCVPGAAMDAITRFNGWWSSIQNGTYIMSISEHKAEEDQHGRLSMWRAFGGNQPRVAIVVKIPWISGASLALNLLFSPVGYLTENEAHSVIEQVIQNVLVKRDYLATVPRDQIMGIVFNMLLAGVTCLKHEGFSEEREWRAIYCPKITPSSLMEASTEIVGGVPQIVYQMPLDKSVSPAIAGLDLVAIFDRVIVGPSSFPWVMYEAFVNALKKAGIGDAEKRVFVSGIPIR